MGTPLPFPWVEYRITHRYDHERSTGPSMGQGFVLNDCGCMLRTVRRKSPKYSPSLFTVYHCSRMSPGIQSRDSHTETLGASKCRVTVWYWHHYSLLAHFGLDAWRDLLEYITKHNPDSYRLRLVCTPPLTAINTSGLPRIASY